MSDVVEATNGPSASQLEQFEREIDKALQRFGVSKAELNNCSAHSDIGRYAMVGCWMHSAAEKWLGYQAQPGSWGARAKRLYAEQERR